MKVEVLEPVSITMMKALFAFPLFVSLVNAQGAQAPSGGDTKVNPKDGLTYVWIPPGTFTMGCSPGDTECQADERPAHRVTIAKGFWIGKTEVTRAAYQLVVNGNRIAAEWASLPAGHLSWDEAGAYCHAVGMRLPTEAEWEYAARGGNPAAGDGTLDSVAWYILNSEGGTRNVGEKQANGYGLHDMLGNVREWVADWYDEKYYASSPATDPKGPSSGEGRIVRGGSWGSAPMDVRLSERLWFDPGSHDAGTGARCAGDESRE
jgi:formylglycine-generating enzyme required for sulfatase activity